MTTPSSPTPSTAPNGLSTPVPARTAAILAVGGWMAVAVTVLVEAPMGVFLSIAGVALIATVAFLVFALWGPSRRLAPVTGAVMGTPVFVLAAATPALAAVGGALLAIIPVVIAGVVAWLAVALLKGLPQAAPAAGR